MSTKIERRTSAPEKADRGNVFTLYPDPVEEGGGDKLRSDLVEHLHERDLFQKSQRRTPVVHSADSGFVFSPVQSADFTSLQYIPQRQKGVGVRCKSPLRYSPGVPPTSRAAAESRTAVAGVECSDIPLSDSSGGQQQTVADGSRKMTRRNQ